MKRYVFIIALLLVLGCKEKKNVPELGIKDSYKKIDASAVKLEIYNFDGLKTFLNKEDNKIHVINFWATWCAPCIKELPYFEKINTEYKSENVEVLLVSLDFPHLYDSKLKPFILEEKLKSKVVALDDVDSNTWIPKVDESWSGALPATMIYKNDKRKFFEKSFTYEELEHELKQFLN
ncbi:TlpA family protein disulfide reductase [Algibacter pacificus]|uniref:TlpA family protein disulfide reductase n=1 Tax=Algibacter pacificus TaxID=2599389 RepID=UPI0011C93157|nr:redoxin domain-containing protein [Algibacter pacificus]